MYNTQYCTNFIRLLFDFILQTNELILSEQSKLYGKCDRANIFIINHSPHSKAYEYIAIDL